ncbi:hypothetical protein GTQ34_02695 [Muricauda sp. JGD-17]|uniref:GLPGLI family protein n=1 Tax=Flagellimonas ochracea TaxID=2696472 RepID=A0A964T9N4_9FLAO|nr:hypothetical protein [Allomuricauda ochracea]NAY90815.1 hypothetical protein [Allomuricauda ochracea]
MNTHKGYVSCILCFGCFLMTFGQQQAYVEYYNAYDERVGIENTGLYQGEVYAEKYRTINEQTQFFRTLDFQKGNVCYDGQCYYGLDLKYDLYEDQVLMKLISSAGGGTLRLFKEYVDSFELGGLKFVKLTEEVAPGLNAYGFYAKAMESPTFILYTKYNKKSFERKDRSSIYYEFLDGPSEHVLLYKGKHHIVNSKKDMVDLFPDQKRQIDRFYRIAKSLRRSDPNQFQVSLVRRIETLLNQSNKPVEE